MGSELLHSSIRLIAFLSVCMDDSTEVISSKCQNPKLKIVAFFSVGGESTKLSFVRQHQFRGYLILGSLSTSSSRLFTKAKTKQPHPFRYATH